MLKFKLKEILEEEHKSGYWLSKSTGIAANAISKMCNQETTSIRFDTLEKICIALNCTPDDLFESTDKQFNILINKEDGTS